MMKALSTILLLLLSFAASAQTPAQNAEQAIKNRLPMHSKQSPEAAAFMRHTDVPVSHYTGLPSISIPIYTLQTQSLSASLSLNYHASGIKVEDEATQVGLGWSLDAGGMISRAIRGRDDFDGILRQDNNTNQNNINTLLDSGYVIPPSSYAKRFNKNDVLGAPVISLMLFCGSPNNNLVWEVARRLAETSTGTDIGKPIIDGQYDIFNFKAGGYSGKFIITRHKLPYKVYVLSQEPIKIELLTSNITGIGPPDMTGNSGFKITTPDGNQYFYTMTESSRSIGGSSRCGKVVYPEQIPSLGLPTTRNGVYELNWDIAGGASNTNVKAAISSWHLTKIVSGTNENDVIFFDYGRTSDLVTLPLPNRSQNITTTNKSGSTWRITDTRQQIVKLTAIRSAFGSISFNRSDRIDIRAATGYSHQKLDKIIIQDSYNQQLMAYQFNYSYFDSGDANQPDFVKKRLRLDSVLELGQDNTSTQPPHTFTYVSTADPYNLGVATPAKLPNKNSYAQDFWGYYNGEDTNNTLWNVTTGNTNTFPEMDGNMVSVRLPDNASRNAWGFERPAVRDAKLAYAKLGTLESMRYPTGGMLKLVYEFHEFNNCTVGQVPNSLIVSDFAGGSPIRGAGLRVAETQLYPDPAVPTKYLSDKFTYLGNAPIIAGKLMYDVSFSYFIDYSGGGPGQVFSSTPKHAFSQSASGNPVGYSKVRESQYNAETNTYNGFVEYEFENKVDRRYDQFCFPAPDIYTPRNYSDCSTLPDPLPVSTCDFVTPIINTTGVYYGQFVLQDGSIPNSFSSKNGLLLNKRTYNADSPNKLQQEENYQYSDPVRVQFSSFTSTGRAGTYENYPAFFMYYVNAEWTKLNSKTTISYPANDANSISSTVNYSYSPVHHQVVRTTTTNSKNETISSFIKYPNDYVAGTNIYQRMVQRNMITPTVTQIDSNKTKNVEISKVQNDFFSFGTTANPLIFVGTTAKTIGGAASTAPDATFNYNLAGNLVEIMPRSGVPMSFIWGYYDKYPVAQIEGMTNAQTQTAITATGLNPTSFQVIAGATQDARDLDLITKLTNLQNTISPQIAQLTGYTYKSLVGKTSEMQPNGRTVYYTYDAFNRLEFVKDHDKNVLKSYKYNYRPQ